MTIIAEYFISQNVSELVFNRLEYKVEFGKQYLSSTRHFVLLHSQLKSAKIGKRASL